MILISDGFIIFNKIIELQKIKIIYAKFHHFHQSSLFLKWCLNINFFNKLELWIYDEYLFKNKYIWLKHHLIFINAKNN
jgi:hypothetical protein